MPQGIPYINSVTASLQYQGVSGTPGILADGYGNVPFVPSRILFPGTNGLQLIDTNTYTSIGAIEFNPLSIFNGNQKILRQIFFEAICQTTSGVTASIRLYNITDGLEIINSILTVPFASSPIRFVSPILSVPSELPNGLRIYGVQLRIISPTSITNTDRAFCQSANIVVDYSSIT